MKSKVEVLTTPTADTPGTALLLEFPDRRYLFGQVHEGCQRAMVQRGKKLIKITDLFLTGLVEWRNIGGLLGTVITAADSKTTAQVSALENLEDTRKRKINNLRKELDNLGESSKRKEKFQQRLDEEIRKQSEDRRQEALDRKEGKHKQTLGIHGGKNLRRAVATARRFIFRNGMPLDVQEIVNGADTNSWTPTWKDSNIEVYAMPLLPDDQKEPPKGVEDHDRILKTVVSDMFDSNWRIDALFETQLADVQMPATIFVRNEETHSLTKWTGPKPGEVPRDQLPDIKVLVRRPWPAALVAELPRTTPSRTSMSYIVKNFPQRGRFLADKAKELGVPVNHFRALTEGTTVTLDNGDVVSPEQVLGPGKPGGSFAVVDLPSRSYVKGLIDRPEWKSEHLMEGMHGIFWLLGPDVAGDADLHSFMKRLDTVMHVISSKDFTPNYLAFGSVASTQLRLAGVDKEHHPVLEFNNEAKPLPVSLKNCVTAHPGQMLQLEPKASWETSMQAPFLDCAAVIKKTPNNVRKLAEAISKDLIKDKADLELASLNLPGSDAEIITLGTGSALPSKHRNVSGTLLRVPGKGSYLFDAGEGTLGQLARMFKPNELLDILRDLRMIWISHMHADHHLGTISVIREWHRAVHGTAERHSAQVASPDHAGMATNPAGQLNKEKLFVISDKAMITFLDEYAAAENFGYDRVVGVAVVPADVQDPRSTKMYWQDCDVGFNTASEAVREAMKEATGMVDLQAAVVEHCNGARAVSITFSDGFKVSYSGDCRPSKRFVEIGRGSTLLIHEATFDDELIGDARAKKHSTASEAIRVGIEMGAPRILLTHFSQRYSKIASLDAIEKYQVQFEDADPDAGEDGMVGDVQEENPETIGDGTGASSSALQDSEGAGAEPAARPKVTVSRDGKAPGNLKIGTAHDYMRVKVKDIAKLERFAPAINLLFEHEEDTAKGEESPKKRKRESA